MGLACDLLAVSFVIALVAGCVTFYRVAREEDAFEAAAQRLGLDHLRGRATGDERILKGTWDGQNVRAEMLVQGGPRKRRVTRFVASGVPDGLTLRARGALDGLRPTGAGADFRSGDEEFDTAVLVHGDPVTLRLCLDARARRAIRGLLRFHGGEVKDGQVEVERGGRVFDPEAIVAGVQAVARVASELRQRHEDAGSRLVEIATGDPEGGVRHAALGDLIELWPALADEVAPRLAKDHDLRVRVLAATRRGSEGLPVLRAALGSTTHEEALLTAVGGLAKARDEASESPLVRLLEGTSQAVRVAAVRALGDVASVGAVEALLPLTRGALADGELKAAAQDAIVRIQTRAGNPDRGRVALVEDRGQVALAGGGDVAITRPVSPDRGDGE